MPAHHPACRIGRALKSNGRPVTALEWRANWLVDALVKNAAARGAAPKAHIKLLESADALVKHCLGQLGAATFDANNAVETIALENGDTFKRVRRDAQQPLRTQKGRAV